MIETNPVKRAVQYQVASVEKDVADVGQNTADFFSLTVTRFTLLTIQIELWMPPGFFLGNPFMTCIYETINIVSIFSNTYGNQLFITAFCFFRNYNTCCSRPILLSFDEHC